MWLDNQGDEIGKDAHDGPSYEHKDQYSGDAPFHIGVLPKEVACIEQEPNQKDDPQDNGEDDPYGVRDFIYRILDAPNLGLERQDGQQ